MKTILAVISLFSTSICFSQGVAFATHLGIATVETPRFKKLMLAKGFDLSYEHQLSRQLTLSAGIGITNLNFDLQDSPGTYIFSSKRFINIPIAIRKYYTLKSNSWAYVSVGVNGSYCTREQLEIRSMLPVKATGRKNLGYNIGGSLALGYKNQLNARWTVDIGVMMQQDYVANYKMESDQLKAARTMLHFSLFRIL